MTASAVFQICSQDQNRRQQPNERHQDAFAPAIGITEDPVTGNGHGPLGAYLVQHGIVPAPGGHLAFTGRQGSAMGRSGAVRVSVEARSDGELLVSIAGDATTAFRAELYV